MYDLERIKRKEYIMKLIIAEKPMLARAIYDAIDDEPKAKSQSYLKAGDYIITWAFGHLLTLKEPEDYDEKYKKWSLSDLPIYFEDWEVKPSTQGDSKARLKEIGALLKKADTVINAGDPDEEGQLLIDEILDYYKFGGKVLRLMTGDTTKGALKKALARMDDNTNYRSLGESAKARSIADALVGYNASRYFTLKNPNTLLTVGRVQSATLGLIVNRDREIEGHKTRNYFEVLADVSLNGEDCTFTARYKASQDNPNLDEGKIFNRNYAETLKDMLRNKEYNGVVDRKVCYEYAPLPFNLVKLQTYASRKFGYNPKKIMEITQSLRDNYNAITYNRSDCQYLTDEQFAEAPATVEQVIANIKYEPKGLNTKFKSKAFNTKNTTAHTAIIPTNSAVDVARLTSEERDIYLAICKYYLGQFLPPAEKEVTTFEAKTEDGGTLRATSTIVTQRGYLTVFREEEKEEEHNPLSKLENEGKYKASVDNVSIEAKETHPPKRYTKASLNEDMTRIAKYVKDEKVKSLLLAKDKDKKGENGSIGTVATRADIIDKLVERGYAEENGKTLISTQLGRELYRILPDELKKPDMTAYWWAMQEDIREGRATYKSLVKSVKEMLDEVLMTEYPKVDMNKIPDKLKKQSKSGNVKDTDLLCPRCGSKIIETKLGFSCSGYQSGCKFTIWKNAKGGMMKDVHITANMVKTWLSAMEEKDGYVISKNAVHLKNLFSAKKSDHFEADVRLKEAGSPYGAEFELDFEGVKKEPVIKPLKCPVCASKIRMHEKFAKCINKECNFTLFKELKIKNLKTVTLEETEAERLIKGEIIVKSVTTKQGDVKKANLVLREDNESPYGAEIEAEY